ncbi:MAG: WXG100 family type VII secretion target [Oscillospiraceae bacterium]|nr:WXG100 family type VII secretion target [Oscillospiraceae bacterium]
MASRLEVTVSELQQAASNISTSADDYESAANALKSAADELAATWEGDSQVAFVEEQTKAYEWYQKMTEICREFARAMETAAQKYEETDAQATSTIRSK